MRKYGFKNVELYKRTKTWIFILSILQLLFVFIQNLITPFAFFWACYTMLVAGKSITRQLNALFLFTFFMKRMSKLMTREQKQSLLCLRNTIIGISVGGLFGVLLAFIRQIIRVSRAPKEGDARQDASYLCHSLGTITVSMTWIAISIALFILQKKVQKMHVVFNRELESSQDDSFMSKGRK